MFLLYRVRTNTNLMVFVDYFRSLIFFFLLSGLIETAPVLPEDDENTSERVSLRCLEELFCLQNSHGSVDPVSRAVLNPSASCDDVLDHILYHILQKVKYKIHSSFSIAL